MLKKDSMVDYLNIKSNSNNKKKQKTSTPYSILFTIAIHGPKSMWELASELNKSYGNIHNTVKKLTKAKEKLIKQEPENPS
jgi:DNA-binding MarR family transcriptional regulator